MWMGSEGKGSGYIAMSDSMDLDSSIGGCRFSVEFSPSLVLVLHWVRKVTWSNRS